MSPILKLPFLIKYRDNTFGLVYFQYLNNNAFKSKGLFDTSQSCGNPSSFTILEPDDSIILQGGPKKFMVPFLAHDNISGDLMLVFQEATENYNRASCVCLEPKTKSRRVGGFYEVHGGFLDVAPHGFYYDLKQSSLHPKKFEEIV